MATIQLGPQEALYYEYVAPASAVDCTYVFFNALTGDSNMWEAVIAPKLREFGHGTLVYNFRGQTNSPFAAGTKLDADLIVDDALRLLQEVKPVRPVLVGLSIGGLFAAQAWLGGAEALGLVLINMLRRDGPRLQWFNETLVRCVEVGGLDLFRDMFTPLLFNEHWLATNRTNFFKSRSYTSIGRQSGHYNLLVHAKAANWDLPYEQLTLPTLVITGWQDHIFFDAGDVEALFARLPRAQRFDMPDAGHLIPVERPEALVQALFTFARDL